MPNNNSQSARADHPLLEPDREQLRIFIETIFRHAGGKGFVSLRAFYEDPNDKRSRITPTGLSSDSLNFLIEAAEDDARRAAQEPRPMVFCPPLAVFSNDKQARDIDVALGLAISVECDQHPKQARAKLEAILGPATVTVKSGGRWTNGADAIEDKLHLHWVLVIPAAEAESLHKLKQARVLATKLVEGDASGTPISHCYRWPGSWHRKDEPRMCVIEDITANEIDLDTALQKLKAAVPDADLPPPRSSSGPTNDNDNRADGGFHYVQGADGEGYYDLSLLPAAVRLVQAAVKVIPNDFTFDQPSRQFWIDLSYSIYYATRGSEEGRIIFKEWSMRSPKYNVLDITDKAWTSSKGADGRLGYRHLDRLASQADPGWDRDLFPNRPQAHADNDSQSEQGAPLPKPQSDQQNASPHWSAVIPRIDFSKWDDELPPQQEWAVPDRIPVDSVCLFSGEGSAGKSLIALQLAIAKALGRDWFGSVLEPGPALFIDAEDPENIIHKRATDIVAHYGVRFTDLKDLHLVSLIEQGAVLGHYNRRFGWIESTSLYKHLLEMVGDLKPKIITIASSANVFAGSEIERVQVQQFVVLLTRLARRCHGSVVLISHPSLTGISTETGLSGSTQWHNAVRARFYLKSVKPPIGEQTDSTLREIVFMKNNYGPISSSIALQYQNGLFVPIEGGNLDAKARAELAQSVFLTLLQRFIKEERTVCATPGHGYAPSMFEPEKEARDARVTKKDLADAMRELLRAGRIINRASGPPSRPRHALEMGSPIKAADLPF